jgi:hypothetical protein
LKNQKLMQGLLMRTSADVIRRLCRKRRYLGGVPAILAASHTWTGRLIHHPHVHFLISAGGMSDDGRWRDARRANLLPRGVLSRAIAAEFRRRLEARHPEIYRQCDARAWRRSWCRFIEPTDGEAVLEYLSRYVHRTAITDDRIVAIVGDQVVFRYRDRKAERWRTEKLDGVEFLRRFLLHVPPRGFHRVRYYGLWNPKCRPMAARAWFQLIAARPIEERRAAIIRRIDSMLGGRVVREDLWRIVGGGRRPDESVRCPHCGGEATIRVEVFRGRWPGRYRRRHRPTSTA